MREPNSLSARKIARLTKRGRYPDGRVPGLLFQVSKTGGRSWVLRYCLNKRERMLGLGRFDLVSVDYARDRARAALRMKPRDPEASVRVALREVRCPRCNGHGRPRIVALARHPSI